MGDPKGGDVAYALEPATDAQRRLATSRLGVRGEVDGYGAQDLPTGDCITKYGIWVINEALKCWRVWARALRARRQ